MSIQLQSRIPQIARSLEQRAAELVRDTAEGIVAHAKQSMAESKSGREYKRNKKGRQHIASAPGESPAIDTGFLANSLNAEHNGLISTVGTNAEYAMHLEFGTVKMEPRPFLEPAFEAMKPEFEKGLKELI